MDLGFTEIWIKKPVLIFSGCVILGVCLNLSVSWFLHE